MRRTEIGNTSEIPKPKLLVLCDRDDTITEDPGWFGRDMHWASQTKLVPQTIQFLKYLQQRFDISLVVVSNQAGVGLSLFDSFRVDMVNRYIDMLLRANRLEVKHWIYEPDLDQEYVQKK